jgi:hypothetical protein
MDGTVGAAGGWPIGGGHSILSPFYGLGMCFFTQKLGHFLTDILLSL